MSAGARTVGVVGGGQLARMLHQAAISLGVEVLVLDPDAGCAAARAGARRFAGTWTAADDLVRFARTGVDVVTFDHELSAPDDLRVLEALSPVPIRPRPATKLLAQDKLHARSRFAEMGLAVPAFAAVRTVSDLSAFAERHGWPLVLKARRGGYDGRGVWVAHTLAEGMEVLAGDVDLLVEELVAIDHELAVMVARRPSGQVRAWPAVRTTQVDGVCTEVIMGPSAAADTAAGRLAVDLAARIGLSGVMAVEFFVTRDNGLVVNEIACRPHNSGHITMDGCVTSQFEQHLRAVLDLPLGDPRPTADAAVMINLLGGTTPWGAEQLAAALRVDQATLHVYGKGHRPGRKLGHVNAVGRSVSEALRRGRRVAAALGGTPGPADRGDVRGEPPRSGELLSGAGGGGPEG